ncbi:MAG: hypothetical protein VYC42_12890 [Pseudomonadota bacterium]|nr:hypothetical protein [Pseudomonadota bacterium]
MMSLLKRACPLFLSLAAMGCQSGSEASSAEPLSPSKASRTQSTARMTSASPGQGELAGSPIDVRFERFPMRDIMTMGGEVQAKAGIGRPCMLRLSMKDAETHASFSLQMDNDGPMAPGRYDAADAVAPETAPGQFLAGFSFGKGRDRVTYTAASGTLSLTTFSPGLLEGEVEVVGRLPRRTYGEAESPWPPSLTVRTEFSVVPRVNRGSRQGSENCFGG